jgi:4'-phosphopantetheinyl transferase
LISHFEVHVWRLSCEPSGRELTGIQDCLDEDEIARAARFRFEADRLRFVACRLTLRRVLGRYLEEDARKISFEYGPAGKPALAGDREIRFNLSHSHDACVIAVARGREVGVDVEKVRELPGSEEIARRFFSPEDWSSLSGMPAERRQDAFFRFWVRNEAAIKATGLGFSAPSAGSLNVHELPEMTTASGERYFGAVAAEGRDWQPSERNLIDAIPE